ncbi:hypothetical protein CEG15_18680 [Vibrio anguillarum]|nr:hypothetical protein CEG15_18680 [Vibrio anguillarum]
MLHDIPLNLGVMDQKLNAQINLMQHSYLDTRAYIPFLLEAAAVLATFVHPNHIVCLCSWGLTHLPPTCNSKLFGYS